MKIAIIAAMEEELELLKENVNIKEVVYIHPFSFIKASFEHHELIIARSGVGRVASALLFGTLASNFPGLDLVINIGIAGGKMEKVKEFDVVLIEGALYGDVDLTPVGYHYGQMSKCPVFFELKSDMIKTNKSFKKGYSITCDRFMTDKTQMDNIQNKYFSDFEILCYDMETASYAQAAYLYNVPFCATRVISDILGVNDDGSYERNSSKACHISCEFILDVLKRL